MKNQESRRDEPRGAASEEAEQQQMEVNAKARGRVPAMGRRDRALGDTLPPDGQLQREGIWQRLRG